MDVVLLFSQALNLPSPWVVKSVELKPTGTTKELHIEIDFERGGVFPCPVEGCGKVVKAHDTAPHTWRHMNFLQYKTYITARVPRTKCSEHGVKMVTVPWARPGSGFTMMFEAHLMLLAQSMPIRQVAQLVDEYDTRIWRVVNRYVSEARSKENYEEVTAIGIDETSRRGHNYITSFVDLKEKKVVFVSEGKSSDAVDTFVKDFKEHSGNPDNVKLVTCDMSAAFRAGVDRNFKNADTIIDKFHVVKLANDGVDKVRRSEVKTTPELKGSKYFWLRNENSLTERQHELFETLKAKNLKTGRAYAMKTCLQDIYFTAKTRSEAESGFRKLCSWMMHSQLEPMKACALTIRRHIHSILNYFQFRKTNALLEGMNSIIQNLKRRSRGFRNLEYFKTEIYLVCGKLNLPTASL